MDLEAVEQLNDPVASARVVGLRYVTDDSPGICRERCGRGFRFRDTRSGIVRDPETLRRIRSLAIPPAWTDVWISPDPGGHLQATGRDDRGRKQHRYHARWREIRDETKFARMIAFAKALPRIRQRVERDLALPGLPRNKVEERAILGLLQHRLTIEEKLAAAIKKESGPQPPGTHGIKLAKSCNNCYTIPPTSDASGSATRR